MSEDNQKNRLPLSSDETTAAGETAKRLLEETDMSISEIAHELGYESLTYFERMFKSFMTISPLKYRKTLNTVTYTNEQTTEFEEDTERLSSHRQSYIHHNFV